MFEMECHNSGAGQNPIDLEQLLWLLTSWIFYILYISAWHRLEASIVKRATQGSLTMTTPFTALSQRPTMPCTLNHNISVQLYPGSVEPKSEGGFSAQCNALIMKKWCTWNRIRWVCHTLCGEQLTLHSELQGGQVSGTLRSSSQNVTKYLSEPFQVEFDYLLIAVHPKLQNMFVNCTRRAQNNKQKTGI